MSAVISGVGEVPPSRGSGATVPRMVMTAARAALDDAGLAAEDIEGIVTESSVMPSLVPASDIGAALGMKNLRVSATSSPVGAGILQAIGIAQSLVDSGAAQHVLSYFSVDWASRRAGPATYHDSMTAKSVVETPVGFAGPPLYFALVARRYAHTYGLTDGEMQNLLADVVIAMRDNGQDHPHAQLRRPIDLEQYAASPMIASPLRKADCCLLSDGAVAFVVSRRESARVAPGAMVGIAGWAWADDQWDDASFYSQSGVPRLPAATAAMARALSSAGMSTSDIDVRQVYDCFSVATVAQLEALGFCREGEAADYVSSGALRHSGANPTNTHGGLLSHGYLLGANHVSEAIAQLRHAAGGRQVPGASVAMVGAGPGRQYCALLLKRGDS